jgi:hypothetical protein
MLQLIVLCGVPAIVDAQRWGVSAVAIVTSHELLDGVLVGPALRGRFPLGGEVVGRISFERTAGSSNRLGIPCSGIIPPDGCEAEPLRDDGRLTSFTLGIAFPFLTRHSVVLESALSLRAARGLTRTFTRNEAQALSDGQFLLGGDFAIDATWSPWQRVPVALEFSVGVGAAAGVSSDDEVDGYQPLQQGFGVARITLGMIWRPATSRRQTPHQ